MRGVGRPESLARFGSLALFSSAVTFAVSMHALQQVLVFLVALASLCPLAAAGADAGDVLAVLISVVIAMVLLCAFLGWYSRRM